VPTNTASYASSQVPDQELAASRLQAVSTGRDLLQAASTGYSAAVDARGTVLRRTALGDEAVLEERLGLRAGWTLFDRYGELPTLLAAALASVAALADLGRSLATAVRRRVSRQRARWCPAP
jgi:apolipoprotein N-acyltransferase